MQSGDALFTQNRFSLQQHYRERVTLNSQYNKKSEEISTETLTTVEKITVGSVVTFVAIIGVVILAIHCSLVKLKRRIWFLGYRPPVNGENEEGRPHFSHPAYEWRYEKEKELKKLMAPFKFDKGEMEYEEQTECCIC